MLDFRIFTGEHICLAPLDLENNPPLISGWTEDSAWMRAGDMQPYRPLSAAQMRKRLEKAEKHSAQGNHSVIFGIRTHPDDRLIGFAILEGIEYNKRARRLYQKIGFVEEGREREFCHQDGRRYDLVYMGLLRRDWVAVG